MATCAVGGFLVYADQAFGQTATSNTSGTGQGAATSAANSGETQATRRAQQVSQNLEASSAATVGELVVTAGAHETTLQKVPIAITDFTDERRNLVGIEDENDIVNFTPSASLNGELFTIRGVGRLVPPFGELFGPPLGTDPGIGVSVDGIYTFSPDYLNQPDMFTDHIEILRGPQGTEGGRNTLGGLANIVEKEPTPDFHEEGRIGYTNYDDLYAQASASGPITDQLRFRLAYAWNDQPSNNGPFTNLASSNHPGAGQGRLFEGQLQWDPTKDIDIWFKAQNYSETTSGPYPAGFVLPSQFPGPVSFSTGLTVNPQTLLNPTSNPSIRNPLVSAFNFPSFSNLSNDWAYTLRATWTQPWGKIQYIGGYSYYTFGEAQDLDGTALTEADAAAGISPQGETLSPFGKATAPLVAPSVNQVFTSTQSHEWYQNELKFSSNDSQPLKWVFGVFQYAEGYSDPFSENEPNNASLAHPQCSTFFAAGCAGVPTPAANPSRSFFSQDITEQSQAQALYGQVDYDVTDQLRLTGGFRYSWDQKQGTINFREIFDTAGLFLAPGIASLDVTPSPSTGRIDGDWSDWSGKLGVEYRPDSSTLLFVDFAKGYNSGGLTFQAVSPPTPLAETIKPETVYDFEGGVKKTFGSTLLVDADIYYYDYQNLQEEISELVPITSPVVTGGTTTSNIAEPLLVSAQKARTYGFELESVWSPTADFHLTFNYSYLNARFTQFTSPTGFVDTSTGDKFTSLDGNILPYSPTNKVTVNPLYTVHTEPGDLTFSATYAFMDKEYSAVFTNPGYLAPSFYTLDLRLLFQPRGGHYTFILFGRNVTNNVRISSLGTGPLASGPANLSPNPAAVLPTAGQINELIEPPRTFGGEFQVRF
jgi:iron complex outermembrane recepter protein